MQTQIESVLSFDELLAQEEAALVRHQYICGRLYPMHESLPIHARMSVNVTTAVGIRLRGKSCRGTSNQQRVRTGETAENWYYADFIIKCPPYKFHPRDKNSLLNPSAIFEILSPKTEAFDRTGKFDEYALIDELTDYVLVSLETVRVEHFRRLENGDWVLRRYTRLNQELDLGNFEISVPLSEIYEGIEPGEQMVLPTFEDEPEE